MGGDLVHVCKSIFTEINGEHNMRTHGREHHFKHLVSIPAMIDAIRPELDAKGLHEHTDYEFEYDIEDIDEYDFVVTKLYLHDPVWCTYFKFKYSSYQPHYQPAPVTLTTVKPL